MATLANPENLVYERPESFTDTPTHYCPGCTHGVAHRLVAEVLDEMNLTDRTIGVAPVGCAVFAYNYFATDFVEAAHGRAPAMATGIKRVQPNSIVFTYQGDGDLASIGMGEIVHAAARGENITVIFINNANFRRSLHDPKNIRLAKKAIRIAFEVQNRGLGFSLVELLSTCPSNWDLSPVDSLKFVAERMIPYYPLGDYKVAPAISAMKI
jgi:2-oxoglutarate ferredoxin oxidoreductase subunit beta